MTTHEPPPEARLIERLRKDLVPPLSMREAARRAGISVATWTQNEQGYRKVTQHVVIPITATAEKLARMALVVGATPEQLREAGREDAAVMLAKIIEAGPDPGDQLAEAIRLSSGLTDLQKQVLIELVQRGNG